MLFLLYINDTCNAIDDTNLFISGKCTNDTVCEAKGVLELLNVWFRLNQLTLNLSKTCYTTFSRHMYGTSVPLLLQSKQIELVKSAKYLGIYLVCKLSWCEHIKELCMELSKLSNVFHHITSFISPYMVRQLYYAYVFPHI